MPSRHRPQRRSRNASQYNRSSYEREAVPDQRRSRNASRYSNPFEMETEPNRQRSRNASQYRRSSVERRAVPNQRRSHNASQYNALTNETETELNIIGVLDRLAENYEYCSREITANRRLRRSAEGSEWLDIIERKQKRLEKDRSWVEGRLGWVRWYHLRVRDNYIVETINDQADRIDALCSHLIGPVARDPRLMRCDYNRRGISYADKTFAILRDAYKKTEGALDEYERRVNGGIEAEERRRSRSRHSYRRPRRGRSVPVWDDRRGKYARSC